MHSVNMVFDVDLGKPENQNHNNPKLVIRVVNKNFSLSLVLFCFPNPSPPPSIYLYISYVPSTSYISIAEGPGSPDGFFMNTTVFCSVSEMCSNPVDVHSQTDEPHDKDFPQNTVDFVPECDTYLHLHTVVLEIHCQMYFWSFCHVNITKLLSFM